jgi:hypothetical protein
MNAEPAQRRVPHVSKPPKACLPMMCDKTKKKAGNERVGHHMNKKRNEKDAGK